MSSLILTNCEILTINDASPYAEALAVRNGEIIAVGSEREVAVFIRALSTVIRR